MLLIAAAWSSVLRGGNEDLLALLTLTYIIGGALRRIVEFE